MKPNAAETVLAQLEYNTMGPEELEVSGQKLSPIQMDILHAYMQGYRDRINQLERRVTEATLAMQFMSRRFVECTEAINQFIVVWDKMEERIIHLERKDDYID